MVYLQIILFLVASLLFSGCDKAIMGNHSAMQNIDNYKMSDNKRIIGQKFKLNFALGMTSHGYSLMDISNRYSHISFEFENRDVYNVFYSKIENAKDGYRVICLCNLTYAGDGHHILNSIENCFLENRDATERMPF
jgi:hypothetical protein